MIDTKIYKEKIFKLFEKYKYAIVIVAVGIALMNFNFIKPKAEEEKSADPQSTTRSNEFLLEDFERRLENTISSINGAGRIKVTLSLESGTEYIYAEDVKKNQAQQNISQGKSNNYESSLSIVSDRNYGEQPILIKNIYPKFKGAIIVCDGAGDAKVSLDILNAVTSICDLTSEKVSIIKMKA